MSGANLDSQPVGQPILANDQIGAPQRVLVYRDADALGRGGVKHVVEIGGLDGHCRRVRPPQEPLCYRCCLNADFVMDDAI